MKMIVGLGNPGNQYQRNRHNVGFQCVDLLAERHGLRFDIRRGKARAALGMIRLPLAGVDQPDSAPASDGRAGPGLETATTTLDFSVCRLLLVKPQTFMNVSGRSVAAIARFYKVEPADMLVIFDDLDLPLGRIRLRPAGGSGGHNGMKSIIRELGSDQFPRLRVGIDRPPGRMDPADYVLQDFSAGQEELMVEVRSLVADACEHWLAYGIEEAMNAFNGQGVE